MMNFTKEEIDIAVKVLSQSKLVDRWVRNVAKSYGVDLDAPKGKTFCRRERIAAARRLIK